MHLYIDGRNDEKMLPMKCAMETQLSYEICLELNFSSKLFIFLMEFRRNLLQIELFIEIIYFSNGIPSEFPSESQRQEQCRYGFDLSFEIIIAGERASQRDSIVRERARVTGVKKWSPRSLQQIVTLAMEGFVAQVLNSHGNDLLPWGVFK